MPSSDIPKARLPREQTQLNVRVPLCLKNRLASLASRRGWFESSLVREAIEDFLDSAEQKGARR